MLTAITFLPLAVAAAVLLVPRTVADRLFVWIWIVTATVDLALVVVVWAVFDPGGGVAFEQAVAWIPQAGVGYHVGVDGLSLPLVAVTCVLFLSVAVYSLRETRRVRSYVAVFLFLQTVCIGVFVALDLILFFLFFDLAIVAMFFVIAGWGHGLRARAAALKFFLYTFTGSLALLLGFIGLALAARPHTFDIVALTDANPVAGRDGYAALVLLAIGVGLAIKTPTVPVHTWLPPAHTDAPATGSAILAGVLLKMGTYGFVRIAMPILPDAWRRYAIVFVVVGVISVIYGGLVALAQTDFKRMIAYTSVNHLGYVVLAVGAAGTLAGSDGRARQLAVTGAVTQMVSHGLLTGALFLLAGVLYARRRRYDMNAFSGLAAKTPLFAGVTAVAAFGSLGIPGLSGFIAEFQILTGSLATQPVATGIALLGILITAALLVWALQRVFLGPLRTPDAPGAAAAFPDLHPSELVAIVALLVLALAIGVAPRFLLDVIEPASRTLVDLVAR
ncbi:NADH-quinone oxidoreductase subunit M [Plantactinospora sp. KLBMP9567]|uniref:complex I subunit 4 family protein n=1 Tax=Plantactinospora sp. KLBMP9567 TaxID=3085900 RepID=UPI0029811CB3|nr:NADH-quinone oxidoreductase subunit M [Plantactinospora sp. KLBMP9567]MDW5327127.1 NADH-quinone oxidoreductase subunit M [Plantactinospora sp. KLBMP9567]